MARSLVIIWLFFLCFIIGAFFWYNEWIYNLPTPVPKNFIEVALGSSIKVANLENKNKPTFLHFFNPDCPCSRFNIPHFKSLVKKYSNQVNFIIVPVTQKSYSEKAIQERFGLEVPVLSDTSIASICGVYSTPQAVIINNQQQLYFRGNYNKTRYCTDKKTEYAKMALDSLLNNSDASFDLYALKAYGCELPTCTKK